MWFMQGLRWAKRMLEGGLAHITQILVRARAQQERRARLRLYEELGRAVTGITTQEELDRSWARVQPPDEVTFWANYEEFRNHLDRTFVRAEPCRRCGGDSTWTPKCWACEGDGLDHHNI